MNYLDTIAKRFVAKDAQRPRLQHLHWQKPFVVATDAYILLKAPDKYFKDPVEIIDGYPNVDAVIPVANLIEPLKLNVNRLQKWYEGLPKTDLYSYKECPSCEGEGEQECDLGHYHDCERCNGSGELRDKKIGYEVLPEEHLGLIGPGRFKANYIKLILDVALGIAVHELEVYHVEKNTAMHVHVGDVQIALMPVTDGNYSKAQLTDLTKLEDA